jgi:ATP-dependent HslUV protease ATP-binding subunit HslU
VGYVGRDVESMVRDLMSVAISMVRQELQVEVQEEAEKRVEELLLDLLLPGVKKAAAKNEGEQPGVEVPAATILNTREKFRQMLKDGQMEDKLVEIDVNKKSFPSMQVFSGTSFEELDINLGSLSNMFGGGVKKKRKKVTVKQAREILQNEEIDKLVDMDRVSDIAKQRTEEMGIIFIDEIDKIATKSSGQSIDVSREGVQRDILPIVEGSKVNTRYGMIDTSHILFIAAGAFHMSKPSDLIPELQGRFPLRVELQALTKEDFKSILTQPENALIRQYSELIKTEGVHLEFKEDAIDRISEIATEVNSTTENIGARRLHTIMENLLEEVSFNAPDLTGQTITITRKYVDERLAGLIEDRDLTRFIL